MRFIQIISAITFAVIIYFLFSSSSRASLIPDIYVVKSGDSLSGIASKFGVTYQQIMEWNNLSSTVIHPGQTLKIHDYVETIKNIPKVPVDAFVQHALNQIGDPYNHAFVSMDDPDPTHFDCSKLTAWAAHQIGVYMPALAQSQYVLCVDHNRIIKTSDAINTRGALLFKWTDKLTSSRPRHIYHVAISLGDGRVVEAKGSNYGVIVDPVFAWSDNPLDPRKWNRGGLVPGLKYAGAGGFF